MNDLDRRVERLERRAAAPGAPSWSKVYAAQKRAKARLAERLTARLERRAPVIDLRQDEQDRVTIEAWARAQGIDASNPATHMRVLRKIEELARRRRKGPPQQ